MLNTSKLKRISQISSILFRHGFHITLTKIGFSKYLPLHKRFKTNEEEIINPIQLREIFEELGGAFIKLGQLIALRPDLVGEKYSRELEKLLDELPPFHINLIKKIIKDLPYDHIEKDPIGSASISQVHKIQINGKTAVVKVKKPHIDRIFAVDIEIMESLGRKLDKIYNLNFIKFEEVVEEFKRYTNKELDFQHEVHNMEKFYENFKNSKEIKIPKVYKNLSSKNYIVMEYIDGKSILEIKKKNREYINIIANSVFKMIFEDRFFHADLHPGNIFFKDKKIIYLDFGIVGIIDRELEEKLFYLFASLVEADLESTVDALIDLNIGREEVDENTLKQGIIEILGDYYNTELKNMDFQKIFYGTVDVAKRSRIKLPANIILFGKSLVTMEGFCREIDPNFNIVKEAKPYVRKIIKNKLSLKELKVKGRKFVKDSYFTIGKLPERLKDFSRKFSVIEKQITGIDENFEKANKLINKFISVMADIVFFVTFFIASILLLEKGPQIYGMSYYSLMGFIVSFILFFRVYLKL